MELKVNKFETLSENEEINVNGGCIPLPILVEWLDKMAVGFVAGVTLGLNMLKQS